MKLSEKVAQVKAAPVSQIISKFVELKRSGKDFVGLSPFTGEKTPSFYCIDRKGFYKDFSSGNGGDAIDFVQRVKNLSFVEAVEWINWSCLGESAGENEKFIRPRSTAAEDALDEKKRIQQAKSIWQASVPIDNTLASDYLVKRWLAEVPVEMMRHLRFHKRLPHYDKEGKNDYTGPALISAITNYHGILCGVQRLWLTSEGKKANVRPQRKTIGATIGGNVKLFPPERTMGVAEGVETALSAWILYGMPVWAAVSTSGILNFQPPPECNMLFIMADKDKAGIDTAIILAQRVANPNLRVRTLTPENGRDFNDQLIHQTRERYDAEGLPLDDEET